MKCPNCRGNTFDSSGKCSFCGNRTSHNPRAPSWWESSDWNKPPADARDKERISEGAELIKWYCPHCNHKPFRKEKGLKWHLENIHSEIQLIFERCPKCRQVSLWRNRRSYLYECLNIKCRYVSAIEEEIPSDAKAKPSPEITANLFSISGITPDITLRGLTSGKDLQAHREMTTAHTNVVREKARVNNDPNNTATGARLHNFLTSFLLLFALSLTGFGISLRYRSLIPFWLLLGFGCVNSIRLAFPLVHGLREKLSKQAMNKREEKAFRNDQNRQHKEQIKQLLPRVLEIARQNRGAVTIESITKGLNIDVKTVRECLKRLRAHHEHGLYYIPSVERSYRKKV